MYSVGGRMVSVHPWRQIVVRMFAVGHYMESHFSDFNAQIAIAAPDAGR